MEALGLLFVGSTLLLLVADAAESFGSSLRVTTSAARVAALGARRALDRGKLAPVAAE